MTHGRVAFLMSQNHTEKGYIYILECADGSFYTGATKDIEKRIQVHNSGRGAKYTYGRRPVKLVYSETLNNYNEALKREKQIQKMTRAQKTGLISVNKKTNKR